MNTLEPVSRTSKCHSERNVTIPPFIVLIANWQNLRIYMNISLYILLDVTTGVVVQVLTVSVMKKIDRPNCSEKNRTRKQFLSTSGEIILFVFGVKKDCMFWGVMCCEKSNICNSSYCFFFF